jgi:hypothetical protein
VFVVAVLDFQSPGGNEAARRAALGRHLVAFGEQSPEAFRAAVLEVVQEGKLAWVTSMREQLRQVLGRLPAPLADAFSAELASAEQQLRTATTFAEPDLVAALGTTGAAEKRSRDLVRKLGEALQVL